MASLTFIVMTYVSMIAQCKATTVGSPSEVQRGGATIVIVGDVMLGRGVGEVVKERGPGWLFADVRDLLQADLVFANLESPLADLPHGGSPGLNLAAGKDAADALVAGGISVVSLANNHALDAGLEGLATTLAELAKRNVVAVGAGKTRSEAKAARPFNLNGVRVAVLAYNDVPQATGLSPDEVPSVSQLDVDSVEDEIRGARAQADVVVVSIHGGKEYEASPTRRQREIAQRAVQAGAQLVVGSHTHVVQPVEFGERSVVAYGLGNFVFDQWRWTRTTRGLVLRVRVSSAGVEHVEVVPVSLATGRPAVLGRAATKPNANVAFHGSGSTFDPLPVSVYYQTYEEEADLDGDGVPERVLIENGRLQVLAYRDGDWRETWHTPDDWEVERVALGDVDRDGRPEIVFSLWRWYRGRYGNQPFVFGYRDGEYTPVWRGSAVADPIRELAVGDVDGDGRDELVVLEGDPAEGRERSAVAVAIWRWSGWGFVLDWRSPTGRFRNLRLVDVTGRPTGRGVDILVERE